MFSSLFFLPSLLPFPLSHYLVKEEGGGTSEIDLLLISELSERFLLSRFPTTVDMERPERKLPFFVLLLPLLSVNCVFNRKTTGTHTKKLAFGDYLSLTLMLNV